MPGPGYAGRWDFRPNEEEEQVIKDLFKDDFMIPENFEPVGTVFDPQSDNVRKLFVVPNPDPQPNPQTETFCAKLDIDDPLTLVHHLDASNLSLRASDLSSSDMTFQWTKNEDEIPLDDSDEDDHDDTPVTPSEKPKFSMNLPQPKNEDEIPLDDEDDVPVVTPSEKPKFSMNLPPPKNESQIEPKRVLDNDNEEGTTKAEPENPPKKMLKRRNAAMYASVNEDE